MLLLTYLITQRMTVVSMLVYGSEVNRSSRHRMCWKLFESAEQSGTGLVVSWATSEVTASMVWRRLGLHKGIQL